MQIRQPNQKSPQLPMSDESVKKSVNFSAGIFDLAARNIFIGVGTASVLYPLDMVIHTIHSKANGSSLASISSIRPCRSAIRAAAWTSYKYAVTGATMKITTKQQSQGAKAYLLDEKFTPLEEGVEPIESISELMESKIAKQSGIRNTGTAIAASMLFGGAEAFITQSNSNSSVLSKEQLLASKQGRKFEFPQIVTFQEKMQYRLAGLPIRSVKSSLQVGAFMATEAIEKGLMMKGCDKSTAKLTSVGVVATTFGLGVNVCNLSYTKQMITMDPKTMSVDSTHKILRSMMKQSPVKSLLPGAGIAMFYTGAVQVIVPAIENIISNKSASRALAGCAVENYFDLFAESISESLECAPKTPRLK